MVKKEQGEKVLVVDDDHYALTYFSSSLNLHHFPVVTAGSAEAAQRILAREGADRFGCVLADFRMPNRNGLELISWVRQRDANLSTILVTAEGEKSLVAASLREGVADFLEKPISHEALNKAVRRAIDKTKVDREREASHRGLHEARLTPHLFEEVISAELASRLETIYQPRHEVGGDFYLALKTSPDCFVIVVGDVSGHDVKTAFTSAYFQGMLRGLFLHHRDIAKVAKSFNAVLCREWNHTSGFESMTVPVSLSVSMCALDYRNSRLHLLNCGAPEALLMGRDGMVLREPAAHPPMGWYADEEYIPREFELAGIDHVLLYTDGVDGCARELDVLKTSFLHKLLSTNGKNLLHWIESSLPDDLLIMRIKVDTDVTGNPDWHPIINEQYAGDEIRDIDKAQNVWRRSLTYALENELNERVFDVLTCIREAMINAFTHGCEEAPERTCSLQVNYNKKTKVLRIRVDDSGPGHAFDPKKRLKQLNGTQGEQLGLSLVEAMSDSCKIENKGTSLTFEFKLN